jgi:Flp pilus assembly protein TadD
MTALNSKTLPLWLACVVLFFACLAGNAQPATPAPAAATNANDAVLLTISGTVEVAPAGSTVFAPAHPGQVLHIGDQVKSGKASRASLRLSDKSVVRLYELTTMEIKPPAPASHNDVIDVKAGATYFFNRDKPQETQFQTPSASGAIRGTEFNLVVREDGQTELTLLDGAVDLTNDQGTLQLASGEQATVTPGQAPRKTAVLNAVNVIQWTLYYPAILEPDELQFPADLQNTLAASLAAYRSGDLLQALAEYPTNRTAVSGAERVYHAALLLAVGEVDQAQALLTDAVTETRPAALAAALQEMIATVKRTPFQRSGPRTLATEWLAGSYAVQSSGDLSFALEMASLAAEKSTNFGFAWERVAELEFGFGHTQLALRALARSLAISPRNAQALALQGFLLTAENNVAGAIPWFDRAIAADGNLGNAWLGKGLSEIHVGHREDGFRDLLMAAALEPRRSVLRSYLGKAFSDVGDDPHADRELNLARDLDPNDPTSWLYSALLKQQQNRVNQAVSDLDASEQRNDNRSVFRSRMLLDQDKAVSSANLAAIYRDLGMTDVSVREAAKAVADDYANSSAHLFLSDSYYNLLDPAQFNLRYDTVWFNELLLANILSPVGGGRLSQQVSQQDYSKLFATDGYGVASSTETRTDGMFHQTASQYGTFDDTSYALDLDYHHNNGVRVNNGLDNVFWNTTVKQQVTPEDTVMLLFQYEDYNSGDNFQYYYQTNARPNYKFNEQQQPILVGAWHHHWSPGNDTMLLAGRLVDSQQFSDQNAPLLQIVKNPPGVPGVSAINSPAFNVNYQENFEIDSIELNQIFQTERVTLSAGARYQYGIFQTQNGLVPVGGGPFFPAPINNSARSLFQRETGYSYLTVKPLDNLWLTGGFAADNETYPNDFRQPPIAAGDVTRAQLGPKAALVWSPNSVATLRGIYTRSLGGVSLDESYRLEPTQLAGFPQAFRSLISESVVGSQSAPTFETLGAALDLKLASRTYAGIQVERLRSVVDQGLGDFTTPFGAFSSRVSSTDEQLHYTERTFGVSLNQLFGDNVVVGGAYKLTDSDLGYVFPSAHVLDQTVKARLEEVDGYALLDLPSGFFARAEVHWYGQTDTGWNPVEAKVSFVQENIFAGWRFYHRHAELQTGILNLGGGDYNLNPLTVYQELPRKRVFDLRFNFIF